jgi:hypothetical protein
MSARARAVLVAALAITAGIGSRALADGADAGAPSAAPSADPAALDPPGPSCVEQIPDGAKRPQMDESFPRRGASGYAVPLKLTIRHGKGESVLADALRIVKQGEGAKALAAAGFALPDPDGGAGPMATTREDSASSATTELTIPVVPLAPSSGRNAMTLPPLPVTITRAGGELMTLCTHAHVLRVDEPFAAGERDPKVRPNPPARPQREEFVLLEHILEGLAAALVVAAATLLVARWWRRRPRVERPKPRPIPWDVAMAELESIRRGTLLAENKNDVHFDRVTDVVRRYLGDRYQFDKLQAGWSGMETTTDEMKSLLRRVRPAVAMFGEIGGFLDEADLVKFARVFPTDTECGDQLRRAEAIVRGTIPANLVAPAEGASPPGSRAS